MHIELTSEEYAFRQDVLDFLERHLTNAVRRASRLSTGVFVDPPWASEWHRALYEKGWITYAWPKEYGGCGWSSVQRYIYESEAARSRAPAVSPMGVNLVGPVICEFGSDWQKEFYLPRIRSGEDYWCQGFSEPGAGSDLSSLKTRAVRDGDDYVVSGDKIWTTHAHFANMMFALVRTSQEEKQQNGISFLLIDMSSRGVTVKPIITIAGDHEVNQVFLDDVRVPVRNLVGDEGKGWAYAKYLLEFERGGGAPSTRCRVALEGYKTILRNEPGDIPGRQLIHEKDIQLRLGQLEAQVIALETLDMRQVSRRQAGARPGTTASIVKTLGSELLQAIEKASLDAMGSRGLPALKLQGPDFLVAPEAPVPEHGWAVAGRHLNGLAATIFGGASEIQREIIAKELT
ncbi:acyl-CoA dehydrogenase [Sphingomonas sp. ID1715]|uniref:acyl-CoA dehydrogenase family protein n=1 Tax=Sphingomonas sp. ID1715 TaxID=1656898 RepID=UPI0014890325|nr:acyl-CoA dehydrogenase family protein [Sphingomonas sp. ID1715]NNM78072.1 acyl-CoA dehydrogenase [Sphingomonas sp. ID1715]